MLHRKSVGFHHDQRILVGEVLRGATTCEAYYAHSSIDEDPVYGPPYEAVGRVLRLAGTDVVAYRFQLVRLRQLVCRLYDTAIEILIAFLPADLEWQMGDSEKAAVELNAKKQDVQAQYGRLKSAAGLSSGRFRAADEHFKKMFECLSKDTEEFHSTYKQLRDELLKIVDEVESEVQS
jgi:hypothetical protein